MATAWKPGRRDTPIDINYPDIIYVPEDAHFDLPSESVRWVRDGREQKLNLRHRHTYVLPSGFKVHLEKPRGSRTWRLVGTHAECTLCHKPSTVSGGGKSEISKSLTDAIIQGPVFVADFKTDFDAVAALLARDYSDRFREPARSGTDLRPILSPRRSLGSVIKLFTPSADEYCASYNAWLDTIPPHIKELVLVVKRFCKPEWGDHWREHFSVDVINGVPANELRLDSRPIESSFLRVGFAADGSWRTFGLRKDFYPAQKIQMEDDITASIVVPRARLAGLGVSAVQPSLKFVHNCETRLFQRPDDAIHRGYDHQTESDFARFGTFFLQLRTAHFGAGAGADRRRDRLRRIHAGHAGTHQGRGGGRPAGVFCVVRTPSHGRWCAFEESTLPSDAAGPARSKGLVPCRGRLEAHASGAGRAPGPDAGQCSPCGTAQQSRRAGHQASPAGSL